MMHENNHYSEQQCGLAFPHMTVAEPARRVLGQFGRGGKAHLVLPNAAGPASGLLAFAHEHLVELTAFASKARLTMVFQCGILFAA